MKKLHLGIWNITVNKRNQAQNNAYGMAFVYSSEHQESWRQVQRRTAPGLVTSSANRREGANSGHRGGTECGPRGSYGRRLSRDLRAGRNKPEQASNRRKRQTEGSLPLCWLHKPASNTPRPGARERSASGGGTHAALRTPAHSKPNGPEQPRTASVRGGHAHQDLVTFTRVHLCSSQVQSKNEITSKERRTDTRAG